MLLTSYRAQDSRHSEELSGSNANGAEFEKPCSRGGQRSKRVVTASPLPQGHPFGGQTIRSPCPRTVILLFVFLVRQACPLPRLRPHPQGALNSTSAPELAGHLLYAPLHQLPQQHSGSCSSSQHIILGSHLPHCLLPSPCLTASFTSLALRHSLLFWLLLLSPTITVWNT